MNGTLRQQKLPSPSLLFRDTRDARFLPLRPGQRLIEPGEHLRGRDSALRSID